MKIIKLLGISLILSAFLAACSSGEGENEEASANNAQQASDIDLEEENEDLKKQIAALQEENQESEEIDESAEDKAEVEDEDSDIGTRTNPANMNDTIEYDFYVLDDDLEEIPAKGSITINNAVRGDEALSLINNGRYEPIDSAPEGYEWIVYDFTTLLSEIDDPEQGVYTWSTDFKVYEIGGSEPPAVETSTFQERFRDTEVYEGGTATGKLAAIAPIDENFLIRYGKPVGMEHIFIEIE